MPDPQPVPTKTLTVTMPAAVHADLVSALCERAGYQPSLMKPGDKPGKPTAPNPVTPEQAAQAHLAQVLCGLVRNWRVAQAAAKIPVPDPAAIKVT